MTVSSITIKPYGSAESTKLQGAITLNTANVAQNSIVLSNTTFQQQLHKLQQLQKNSLRSINKVTPASNNIFLLGQTCTSVMDYKDPDVVKFVGKNQPKPSKHSLILFDGCKSCQPDCQQVLDLFHDIRDIQVWLNSFKDICLYDQRTCKNLYDKLYKEITVYGIGPQSCYIRQVQSRDRWLYGIRLLYQYKALVALWNYLTKSKAVSSQVSTAPQDFSVICVVLKTVVDLCFLSQKSESNDANKFSVTFNINVADTHQPLPLDKNGVQAGKYGLFFVTDNNNTYIKYMDNINGMYASKHAGAFSGTNIAISDEAAELALNTYIQGTVSDPVSPQTIASIEGAKAEFTLGRSAGFAQLSVAVRVIPVWIPSDWSSHIVSLADYQKFRQSNTQLIQNTDETQGTSNTQSYNKYNTWQISYSWDTGMSNTESDSILYRTPYTRVPYQIPANNITA